MAQSNTEFQVETLKPFMGSEIRDIVVDNDSDSIGIVVGKGKEETILWVWRDTEGNGPGWIFPDPMENYLEENELRRFT